MMVSIRAFLSLFLLLQPTLARDFLGFYETNYNETITMCVYDEARRAVLGRTHWPNTPFNEDSAVLQGICVTDSWMSGVGASIEGGPYSFSMRAVSPSSLDAIGSYTFLDKQEEGVWSWHYLRPATEEECEMVTMVRPVETTIQQVS